MKIQALVAVVDHTVEVVVDPPVVLQQAPMEQL
jgi:hypothetical protein